MQPPISKCARGLINFTPYIQKLEIRYAPFSSVSGPHSLGIVDYVLSGKLYKFARNNPCLEISLVRIPLTIPAVIGYYAGKAPSVILVKGFSSKDLERVLNFLCNSSDGRLKAISASTRTIRPENLSNKTGLPAWDPISTNYEWKP